MSNNYYYSALKQSTPPTPSFANQYSMDFDGVNDVIREESLSFIPPPVISISVWVKTTFTTGGDTTNIGYIVGKDDVGSARDIILNYRGTGTNKLNFAFWSPSGVLSSIASPTFPLGNPADGAWHHILATWDGTTDANKIQLFVDGSLIAQATANDTGIRNSPTTNLTIGGPDTTTNTRLFYGNIDEVAIFNTDQSANVVDIYNLGVPTDLTSLNPMTWWRMGENAVFRDPQWLLPSNENKDNYSNYSLDFDGVNDVVVINNTLDITRGLTMSCWVKFATTVTSTNWLCSAGGTGGSIGHFNTRLAANGQWVNYLNGGAFFVLGISAAELKDGNWHHIAQTIDYSNAEMRFYQDGVESTSIRSINTATTTTKINQIGGASAAPVYPFTGNIDEFAILEGAKSLAEIQEIYNSGVPIDLTSFSLLAWYKMGEDATFDGTNWTVPDIIGSSPGTTANMDISDRVGDAPSSANNAISVNMDRLDKVEDVPT